jgi:Terminase DNA packaging enzyme.
MSKLDETFNVEPLELTTYKKQEVVQSGSAEKDISNDYEYTRENLYNLVENGNAALEDLVELAKQSEHPRTYEVLATLIKTIGDTTDKLSVLHEKQQKLNNEVESSGDVTNNLFVGSTTDLIDILKNKK